MALNLKLLKGLTQDEINDLKGSFKASTLFRRQLSKILEENNKGLLNSLMKDEVLNCPNWALVHQDRLAQIKCNDRLLKLIS
ncbi:MAG: hypothetical protein KUG64_11295 [Cycloclasticus sp.]|nr:hypothetical protein [Cycloclasticus sp.]